MRAGFTFALALTFIQYSVLARASENFEYPELLVSPSASERLNNEAKTENKERWGQHWAIQASALTTLMAGFLSNGDPGKDADKAAAEGRDPSSKVAAKAAIYVGGFWLGATVGLSALYSPYQSGVSSLKNIPQGNKKEKLAYERYAEEALYAPSRIATILRWTSFISNAGVNALVVQGAENSMTKTIGGLGVIASTMPVIFGHNWNEVYRFQSDYKKRIYGPLSKVDVSVMPNGSAMAAVTNLSVVF